MYWNWVRELMNDSVFDQSSLLFDHHATFSKTFYVKMDILCLIM